MLVFEIIRNKYEDTFKGNTGKSAPGTLVGPYKNRKTGTLAGPYENRKTGTQRGSTKTGKPGP